MPQDYAALAKRFGGELDAASAPTYDGSVLFDPNRKPASAEDFTASSVPQGSALGRFAGNAAEMLNPLEILKGLFNTVAHPIETAGSVLSAQVDQGRKAIENARAGRYLEAQGHGLAALLPIVGPAAANAGEQIGSGDIAGGLGTAAGILAPMALPPVARAVKNTGAGAALEASANADVEAALNPTRHRTKVKTERIAPEVRARGITGDIEDVKALAKDQRAAVGEQLDTELLKHRDVPVVLQPVREALARESADTYNLVKDADGVAQKVVHDPRKAAQVEKVREILDQYGDTMTTEQAVAVRRTWDDIVAKAGGFDEKAGNQFGVSLDDASEAGVKRPIVGALRKQLADANPSVAEINKEFKFWADLDDVASATKSRRVGQKRNLTRQIMRGAGMASGAASGAGISGAVIAGEAAARAEQLFSSPRWKLVSAQVKTKLADAIASGDQSRIASALGKATATVNAMRSTSPTGSLGAPSPASAGSGSR